MATVNAIVMLLKSVFLSIATANLSRDKNPDCSSDNPEFACTADCENLYIECVIGCSTDPSCISSCNRESMQCNQQVCALTKISIRNRIINCLVSVP